MFSPVNWPSTNTAKVTDLPERPYSNAPPLNMQNPNPPGGGHPSSPYSPPNWGHVPLNNEVRHAREVYLTDVKSQLRMTSEQLDRARKDLHERDLKIAELEKSISSFWNPELKKERLARKEEYVKLIALKDQQKQFIEENHQLRVNLSTFIL